MVLNGTRRQIQKMSKEPQNSLATAVVNTFQALIAQMNTCLPGEVREYDFKERRASIKPLIKRKYLDGQISTLPIIVDVPVVFPGTDKVGFQFPIKKGDKVLIVFSQRSLDQYLSNGGDVDPLDTRKFDLSDAVAIPGLYPFNKNGFADNNEDLFIKNDGRKIKIGEDTIETIDGVLTGKTVNPFTGTPYSQLPGVGSTGKNMSQKVFGEFG